MVAFELLTQLPQVQFSAFSKVICHDLNAAEIYRWHYLDVGCEQLK